MSTTIDDPSTAAVAHTQPDLREATSRQSIYASSAQDVSGLIRSEATAAEDRSAITDPVVAAFIDTGLYWMMLPTEMGGGCDIITAIDVIETLCQADGATGWSFMANALTTGFAAAFVGDRAADAMFGGQQPGITAGMLAPAGKAVTVEGGIRGGGRFAFGSGCAQADWMGAGMLLLHNGAPILDDEGRPQTRIAYMPRDRVEFHGNWDVSGLRATGSYDYVVADQFIASDFVVDGGLGRPVPPMRGGGIYSIGLMGFVAIGHVAFALGIMRRALEEITEIASTKTRLGYTSTVANNEIFKRDYSYNESLYKAGRAYCHDVFLDAQTTVLSGGTLSPEQQARMRIVATWLTQIALDVTRFCHTWAGAAAIRNPSALGRCTRDIHAGSQHMIVDPTTLAQFAAPIMEAAHRPATDQ